MTQKFMHAGIFFTLLAAAACSGVDGDEAAVGSQQQRETAGAECATPWSADGVYDIFESVSRVDELGGEQNYRCLPQGGPPPCSGDPLDGGDWEAAGSCVRNDCTPTFDPNATYAAGDTVLANCDATYAGTACFENLNATYTWTCTYEPYCYLRPGSADAEDAGWWSAWTAGAVCE